MATPSQDLRNLALVRGGAYGKPAAAAEIRIEQEARSRFAAMRTQDGRPVGDQVVYHIAEGNTTPLRRLSKLFRRLKAKKVPMEQVEAATVELLRADLRQVYGQYDSGEFVA